LSNGLADSFFVIHHNDPAIGSFPPYGVIFGSILKFINPGLTVVIFLILVMILLHGQWFVCLGEPSSTIEIWIAIQGYTAAMRKPTGSFQKHLGTN
jgi:hypothetical protein